MSQPSQFAVHQSLGVTDPRARYDASHPGYVERVYSGVLGKLIGVYLGRPVENWTYERIAEEIGDVDYYIHEKRGRRLIVTDDDISGTFTFLRALEDYGFSKDISSEQIGQTWLNYLIEKTTILWWGGMGNSTEHTAYLRLKSGIPAPKSGSRELNSKIISEQIGAQIFIDGWGLVSPGDPVQAAEFAARAARVSHDGEAVFGAQVVAAMVAQAFVETSIDGLLDCGLSQIPQDSTVSKLIQDVRTWHAKESDWRENRLRLQSEYGYDKYFGQCHLIPNHGLIILSLVHGEGDFDRSMLIVNTSGWDTDCNSGNVGAILGVKGGLEGLANSNWRQPVADRLYLPSADGGRAITDAANEAIYVANLGRALAGLDALSPKDGARFHFSLPGCVQGWEPSDATQLSVQHENPSGLRVSLLGSEPARAGTDTFIPPDAKDMVTGYVLVANPTLYPGHLVSARLRAVDGPAAGSLFLAHYNAEDLTDILYGTPWLLEDGETTTVDWLIPDTGGYPIHEVGIELTQGSVVVDHVDWNGVPSTTFPLVEGTMSARAWAKSVDRFEPVRDRFEFLTHNQGVGLLTQGARDWTDYRVECRITPKMAVAGGIAVRVQGLRRYYSVVFAAPGEFRIDKALNGVSTLARTSFPWEPFTDYFVEVEVRGNEIRAWIDGRLRLTASDLDNPLQGGAFGFIVESGCVGAGVASISPA